MTSETRKHMLKIFENLLPVSTNNHAINVACNLYSWLTISPDIVTLNLRPFVDLNFGHTFLVPDIINQDCHGEGTGTLTLLIYRSLRWLHEALHQKCKLSISEKSKVARSPLRNLFARRIFTQRESACTFTKCKTISANSAQLNLLQTHLYPESPSLQTEQLEGRVSGECVAQ